MQGKRRMVARALWRSGALDLVGRIRRGRHRLVVFNYHRLYRAETGPDTPVDESVFHCSAETFARQVRWLTRHTELLSERTLVAWLRGEHRPRSRPAMITFDDGYIDVYELAYPVLRELGAPAMLFVPTGLIGRRELGWWDQIAYLIKASPRATLSLDGRGFSLPGQQRQAIDHFHERMKLEPQQQTRDLVDRLAQACGVALPGPGLQDRRLMTWDQIREVDRGGLAIGTHTCTHRVLSTLAMEEQREELCRSRQILEQELGHEVRALAYPVGEDRHVNPETRGLAAQCGYTIAFSYLTGANLQGRTDPLWIRRTDGPGDLCQLAATTLLPEVFLLRPG